MTTMRRRTPADLHRQSASKKAAKKPPAKKTAAEDRQGLRAPRNAGA